MKMIITLIVVIVSQCIHILKYQIVHLKYIQVLYLKKSGKKQTPHPLLKIHGYFHSILKYYKGIQNKGRILGEEST